MRHVELIADAICHLGECPVWNAGQQKLYWSDILNRRLFCYDPAANDYSLFWQGDFMVGGFAFTANGDMVLCTDRGVGILNATTKAITPIFDIRLDARERFNDITTDPKGRIFAGTLKSTFKDGTLYRLEKGKPPKVVLQGIECSNGMTFTMDELTFFHTDSAKRRITAYDYEKATGELSNPRIFFQGVEAQGLPDGITIDVDDNLWVAFWGGACIRQINRHGQIIDEIAMPALQPSSVMFGGRRLSALYVTSACEGGADLEKGFDAQGRFLGGPLYRFDSATRGRPEYPADF